MRWAVPPICCISLTHSSIWIEDFVSFPLSLSFLTMNSMFDSLKDHFSSCLHVKRLTADERLADAPSSSNQTFSDCNDRPNERMERADGRVDEGKFRGDEQIFLDDQLLHRSKLFALWRCWSTTGDRSMSACLCRMFWSERRVSLISSLYNCVTSILQHREESESSMCLVWLRRKDVISSASSGVSICSWKRKRWLHNIRRLIEQRREPHTPTLLSSSHQTNIDCISLLLSSHCSVSRSITLAKTIRLLSIVNDRIRSGYPMTTRDAALIYLLQTSSHSSSLSLRLDKWIMSPTLFVIVCRSEEFRFWFSSDRTRVKWRRNRRILVSRFNILSKWGERKKEIKWSHIESIDRSVVIHLHSNQSVSKRLVLLLLLLPCRFIVTRESGEEKSVLFTSRQER